MLDEITVDLGASRPTHVLGQARCVPPHPPSSEPRPGAEPTTRQGRIAEKFAGTVWIDEQAAEVMRIEAKAVENLSFGFGNTFNENMTQGRGFIALAALIFGRWHPVGAFVAALVFGFSEELQGRLSLLDTPLPSELLLMTPYIVTIVVVAGLVGHSRPPAADGQPYTTD